MFTNKQSNKYTHLTATERKLISFPAQIMLKQNLLVGRVLDFGCGLGKDVKLLQQQGFDVAGYDPYYFPEYPQGKFDTILCFYVLNVLFEQTQIEVLMQVSQLLNSSGRAYYAVRRGLKKEGFREHYTYKKPTYQCLVNLPFKSIYADEFREIYEYTHYNQQKNSENKCLFCNPRENLQLITESAKAYAILDGYPVTKGHTLVIPKLHQANYFELPIDEQLECWLMVNQVQKILQEKYQPDGFNVGINVNHAGGQKMMHTNIHVIPRYQKNNLRINGGMRFVIPKKIY
ncbi:MAG: bifunctional class I SAM-dependent methyltransferase/HIT family protein [Trichodesmium sp. St15_bin1_1]|jgi:diadenosine tetraphosphate (Ap4A) HIT family hydrolase|nr:bifunctional class I SAM-dependent methyltransferase/HIT family protein [Trichodesmium sp. MAG_R02]MDE5074519.1 bifunctional class I SAM-dependent methyltransferase/HIT family protein [Trichodesmium sp. St5_bin2_1]MDE5084085.1 bifunctional class I SAM-dependent methyltransferase/HIT family protein [Trichodesmium sp. St18_bin1]MDE5088188.1 bifunctional class I SAM-dependent methyltransferase/HIT family protein [Trichodesmium sp. St16_bin2-tuft]MDE5107107.1 bifunctional class I SAM-dependent m